MTEDKVKMRHFHKKIFEQELKLELESRMDFFIQEGPGSETLLGMLTLIPIKYVIGLWRLG